MAKPKPHEKHRQCQLRRGPQITHTWLPSKYARVGRTLDLKNEKGVWEKGWVVEEVWGEGRSTDVLARADLWKHHRNGTDARRAPGEDGKPGEWDTPHGRRAPVS